jgi:multidrug efflux system membrane fusion protein
MRFKYILLIAILALVGWVAYSKLMPHGGWGGPPGGAPPVTVAEVIQRDVQQWHEFSGRLVAVDQAEIRPQVSGAIMKVHFSDGAMVKKGDLLFTIDPRSYEAALQAAEARATYAEAEFKRAEGLVADKAIPQKDYDQRKNDAAVARADLATARLNLDYTQVKAPISGRTGRAEITEGNLVQSGSSAPVLTTVVSSTPIYADFEIDEPTYLQYVAASATGNSSAAQIPVQMGLASEDGTPHTGHIESFDNRLDNASGTLRVRAVFDNEDGALVPGLFARLRLGSAGMTSAILITDRAVGTDQNRKFVIVVGADNKTEHREVKLGGMADGLRIITDGLKPGEKIIISGLQRIMMPGQPVTPELAAMGDEQKPETGSQKPEDGSQKPENGK